jgi:hypothetical protein
LRNQRFLCSRLRSGLLVERLGMQTRLTHWAFAAAFRVIQALLGHSKPETTARYTRVAIGLTQ